MAGFFFQPRDLTGLNPDALLAYARHCEDTIRQNAIKLAELRGQMTVLGEGVRSDAFWTFGGFALAAASIATTPFFTPAGYGALAGGAASLAGVKGFLDKSGRRHRMRWEIRDIQASLDFCESELSNISRETARRRIIPPR